MKGNVYDYDYFVHCFATFGTLVAKANKIIPNGIDEEFIKFLIRDKKYSQGGWMLKPDGKKIRLSKIMSVNIAILKLMPPFKIENTINVITE